MEDIFELVNNYGGWTITGWSKRGLINDAALISSNGDNESSDKVLSEEVTTHIVQILPTKREYIDLESEEG